MLVEAPTAGGNGENIPKIENGYSVDADEFWVEATFKEAFIYFAFVLGIFVLCFLFCFVLT